MVTAIIKTIISVLKTILDDAIMSEWSKEPVLRSGSESCVGSNPTDCNFFARLAQLVERQTLNLVVAGSSPAVGTKLMGRV